VIETKKRYGDFEGDTLCGKMGREAVSVHYERKAMATFLEKLMTKEAEETAQAFSRTIENLPDDFVKSFTLDNGTENYQHAEIKNNYKIKTYFCDPFKAWQKGGVENINGLIRQYIPKGADMTKIDQNYLKEIQEKLNNRPRKSLGYLTPNEVLAKVINVK
jgi:IS30 family transposase